MTLTTVPAPADGRRGKQYHSLLFVISLESPVNVFGGLDLRLELRRAGSGETKRRENEANGASEKRSNAEKKALSDNAKTHPQPMAKTRNPLNGQVKIMVLLTAFLKNNRQTQKKRKKLYLVVQPTPLQCIVSGINSKTKSHEKRVENVR